MHRAFARGYLVADDLPEGLFGFGASGGRVRYLHAFFVWRKARVVLIAS
jgi:hypothetical protein